MGMRAALNEHLRFLATPRVSKFRIYSWFDSVVLPDDGVYIFARSDDYFFGIVHSRLHEVWARSQGTQVRERESGFRYTPNTCFETFPFPFADDLAEQPENLEAELNAAKHYAHIVLREEPPPRNPAEHRAAIAAAAQRVERVARTLAQSPRMDGGNNFWNSPARQTAHGHATLTLNQLDSQLSTGSRPLSAPGTQRRRLRRETQRAHAYETLQRASRVARSRPQETGCRRRRRLRLPR